MDKRRKTEAQKARTRRARIDRQSAQRRRRKWQEAGRIAHEAGLPFSFHLTLTWGVIDNDDYRPSAGISDLPHAERARRVWNALKRIADRRGVPWIAARAPEYDRNKRHHLHLAGHMPHDALRDVITTIERVTGAPAAWTDLRGRRLGRLQGVLAKSEGGGWLLQRDVQGETGNPYLLRYIAKGSGKRTAEGQHRLSRDLTAMLNENGTSGPHSASAGAGA